MKKLIYLFVMAILVSGCATTNFSRLSDEDLLRQSYQLDSQIRDLELKLNSYRTAPPTTQATCNGRSCSTSTSSNYNSGNDFVAGMYLSNLRQTRENMAVEMQRRQRGESSYNQPKQQAKSYNQPTLQATRNEATSSANPDKLARLRIGMNRKEVLAILGNSQMRRQEKTYQIDQYLLDPNNPLNTVEVIYKPIGESSSGKDELCELIGWGEKSTTEWEETKSNLLTQKEK